MTPATSTPTARFASRATSRRPRPRWPSRSPAASSERLVDEGEMVKQGQLVAELDTADLQCNVDLRRAEVQTAKAALDELLAGSRREDKDAAKAAWEKAAHALADLEAGSRPQEIAAAEAAVAAADADVRRLDADLRRASACFSERRSRPKSTTPTAMPAMLPSRSAGRPSSN